MGKDRNLKRKKASLRERERRVRQQARAIGKVGQQVLQTEEEMRRQLGEVYGRGVGEGMRVILNDLKECKSIVQVRKVIEKYEAKEKSDA